MQIIMEFLHGGTLGEAAKAGYAFNERQIAYVAKEVSTFFGVNM